MNPREALSLIDEVLAVVNGSREDHRRLAEAMNVLHELVVDAEKPKTPKDSPAK